MDSKTKGKVISALRRLTYSYPPRNEAKRRRKVDKALFQCELCQKLCYDGTSVQTFDIYKQKYYTHTVVMEKAQVDHRNPVIPLVAGWKWDWNDYINNMFCDSQNLQLLCKDCHSQKTEQEKQFKKSLGKNKEI